MLKVLPCGKCFLVDRTNGRAAYATVLRPSVAVYAKVTIDSHIQKVIHEKSICTKMTLTFV